ncbi:D-glycerate dehydrogenase [Nonomuraea phyllanthi]|uniref:D-glycerate dehydrogenase n=1 Tax=Nonomuraea phyllanthi TaxID=2219224 RepID=A0A5C4VZM7_9ACTN|nr:D-glycerate dehydrogenase [Nonomuraea phyllanthi]KAB8190891.1 D-glycerate dehydrogenase [Nonomuraea phyllanthi]QFY11885.1 D-glycerate dehydrogenase [Nonomuraea phyllanthi]
MNDHIYVTRTLTDAALARVRELDRPAIIGAEEPPGRATLLREVAGAAAVVCTLTERIDAELLDAAGPGLRVVANVAVGYDNIDVAAATERGVRVTNTPGVLDGATADLAFALILAASRRVLDGDRLIREGTPWIWGPRMMLGIDLSAGATLGVVGYGRIGRAVARRARAFDMPVLATPTSSPLSDEDRRGVEFVELPELLERSDVVTLHCPLTPRTRHLIDAAALRRMKPTAVLVNTARGGVVDERALIEALRSGTIAAAGLDVFDNEPHVDPELAKLPNTVLTPHIGSAGTATRERMCGLAVDNVAAVLAGRAPVTPVN